MTLSICHRWGVTKGLNKMEYAGSAADPWFANGLYWPVSSNTVYLGVPYQLVANFRHGQAT